MPRNNSDPRTMPFFLAEILRNARLAWRLLTDPRVPLRPKMIVPATLFYLVFPIDIVPDIILGLGQLDDLAVLLVGLKLFIEMSPRHLVHEHADALRTDKRSSKNQTDRSSPIEGTFRVVDDEPQTR